MFWRVFVVCCLLMTACGSTAYDELAPRPAVEAVGGAAPTTTTPEPQPEPVASAAPMLDIEFSITPVAADVDAGGKGSGRLQWRVLGATSVELIFPTGRSATVEPVDGLDINFPKGSYRYTLVAINADGETAVETRHFTVAHAPAPAPTTTVPVTEPSPPPTPAAEVTLGRLPDGSLDVGAWQDGYQIIDYVHPGAIGLEAAHDTYPGERPPSLFMLCDSDWLGQPGWNPSLWFPGPVLEDFPNSGTSSNTFKSLTIASEWRLADILETDDGYWLSFGGYGLNSKLTDSFLDPLEAGETLEITIYTQPNPDSALRDGAQFSATFETMGFREASNLYSYFAAECW